jgi:chain length determinant protein EpsF
MNFTQFILALLARKWVILVTLLVVVGATTVITLMLPKEYTATTSLLVDFKSKDNITGQMLPVQVFPGYLATQLDIIKSSKVVSRVVDDLKLLENPDTRAAFVEASKGEGDVKEWLSALLLKNLTVMPARESSLIDISFSGADPHFSAAVANAFAKAYIEVGMELRAEPAKQSAAWFNQQISQLRSNLEQAQQKLTDYQREKGIVESEERMDVETRRLAELASQIVGAQSAAFESASRAKDSRAMPEVFNSPAVQNLKALLVQAEARLADLSKKVGKSHPEYERVEADVGSLRLKLADEMSIASRGLGASAAAARERASELSVAYASQKKHVLNLKRQREEISLLVRDVENAQRIYDGALQRFGQTSLEAQSTQTDVAVLNPASVPTKPSGPQTILNIVLATILGLLFGIGFAFLTEMVDRRVRSSLDVIENLGIPVLAEVRGRSSRFAWLRRLFARNQLSAA